MVPWIWIAEYMTFVQFLGGNMISFDQEMTNHQKTVMEGNMQFDFENLRAKLEEQEYPSVYLFKFIVPSDNQKIAQLQAIFSDDAQMNMRSSKNGKYTSVGAKEVMLSSDSIIERYQKALQIEGCIAL